MVTAAQLQIVQSPITSLLSTISTSVTVKLDDSNYLTWSFQVRLLLESHGIMGFVDGSRKCPPRFNNDSNTEGVETDDYLVWKMHDRALMQLLIATLSTTAMSCIIGCKSSADMWLNLTERFSAVTKATIFQMKTELQNIKKGSESASVYLQKIKDARDHLAAAGVFFDDEDIIILALKGLPADFNTFRCVIRGREQGISLKDFRSQLLAEEAIIDQSFESSSGLTFGSAMAAGIHSDKGKALVLDQDQPRSSSDQSFKHNGGPTSSGHSQGSASGPGSYHNYNGSYHTYGKGNSFRGRGRGRFQYNSSSRFSNGNPGILGTPKPYQAHCPDHLSEIPTCQICNKKGHVAADCFQRHTSNASNPPTQCQICWKYGHSALQCYHRSNFSYQGRPPNSNLTAMHANYQPSAPVEQFWLADTGATAHMTSDLANLDLPTSYQGTDTIATASGTGQVHRENPSSGAV